MSEAADVQKSSEIIRSKLKDRGRLCCSSFRLMKIRPTVQLSSYSRFGQVGSTFLFLLATVASQAAQTPFGTDFTHQGLLMDASSAAASGRCDLRFALRDAANGGVPIFVITSASVVVSKGLGTTSVNLGAGVFINSALWMEVGVRSNGTANAFICLQDSATFLKGLVRFCR